MQQLGPTAAPCIELAQRLVEDFVSFSTKSSDQLKSLPIIAPRFTINFMTAVADLFFNHFKNGPLTTPPDMLLDIFTEWVNDNPQLCHATQPPLALPPGAISMPLLTPLAGLIRWVTLAPIYLATNAEHYSKLHLAILQSLVGVK